MTIQVKSIKPLLILASLCAVALGDTKDDFKKASQANQGCDLIPYSTIQSSCRDNYSKQRDWCTGDKEQGCRGMNKSDPKDRETAKERRDNAIRCIEYRTYQVKIFQDALISSRRKATTQMRTSKRWLRSL